MKGESIEMGEEGDELGMFCDAEKVRAVYKLNDMGGGGKEKGGGVINGMNGEVDEKKELEGVILGMMTIKGS